MKLSAFLLLLMIIQWLASMHLSYIVVPRPFPAFSQCCTWKTCGIMLAWELMDMGSRTRLYTKAFYACKLEKCRMTLMTTVLSYCVHMHINALHMSNLEQPYFHFRSVCMVVFQLSRECLINLSFLAQSQRFSDLLEICLVLNYNLYYMICTSTSKFLGNTVHHCNSSNSHSLICPVLDYNLYYNVMIPQP